MTDIATGYGSAIILALIVLGLCICCARSETARFTAERRAKRAEEACEELRQSLMRGSAVGQWKRPHSVTNADEWYHHIQTAEGPILLTDEQWWVARNRADKLLKKK